LLYNSRRLWSAAVLRLAAEVTMEGTPSPIAQNTWNQEVKRISAQIIENKYTYM
jgi:hypothetical protein